MDTGIWATWYNLADEARETYLEWAHGTYLPFLRQLPGYAWVAHYRQYGPHAELPHDRAANLAAMSALYRTTEAD